MKIFLTGASGYIGGSLAFALLSKGHEVRALTRSKKSAHEMEALGMVPVLGDLDNLELLKSHSKSVWSTIDLERCLFAIN